MITRRANDWNSGLYGACYGGREELADRAEHIIENWGLYGVCGGGQFFVIFWPWL
jgi:hypothetical protein